MLSLHVIKTLEANHTTGPVIWHFCEAGPGSLQPSSSVILRSLILQLLKHDRSLFQYVLQSSHSFDELFGDGYLQTQWTVFEKMIRDSSQPMISCVIDGLDECEPDSLDMFLQKI
jgi:hypothetical protein